MMQPATQSRRGMALIDVVIGGVILAVGLAVVISLSAGSPAEQTRGEKMMTASWLADELLAMVIVEGPDNYAQQFYTRGGFDPPFEDFTFEIALEQPAQDLPYRVTASVRWGLGGDRERVDVETLVASQPEPDTIEQRQPLEPLDRYLRWHPDEDFAPEQPASPPAGP